MGLCFDCNPYDGENAATKQKVFNLTNKELLVSYREGFWADLIPPQSSNDGQGPVVEINETTEGLTVLGERFRIIL